MLCTRLQASDPVSEALAAESKAALTEALQTSEERRILAAEMQTILEATEYRLKQLEKSESTRAAHMPATLPPITTARSPLRPMGADANGYTTWARPFRGGVTKG